MERLLFPQLNGVWKADIPLNRYAKLVREDINDIPWHGKQVFGKWIDLLHETFGVDYSWGGYLENREEMLEGTYLPSGGRVHLGVDFWVPQDTEIYLPKAGTLINARIDADQDGGWGGQLIFEIDGLYYIFGHLDDISSWFIGRQYLANTRIAKIAGYDANGGWHPHLHVQCMRKLDFNVDGYTTVFDSSKAYLNFPDPMAQVESCTSGVMKKHPWLGRQVRIIGNTSPSRCPENPAVWTVGRIMRVVHPEGPAWEALFEVNIGTETNPDIRFYYSESEHYSLQLV